jgi:hypothetical protein
MLMQYHNPSRLPSAARTTSANSAAKITGKSAKFDEVCRPTLCVSLCVRSTHPRHHQYNPCRGSSIGRACGSYNSKEINLKVVGSSPTFGYSYIKAHQSSCSFAFWSFDRLSKFLSLPLARVGLWNTQIRTPGHRLQLLALFARQKNHPLDAVYFVQPANGQSWRPVTTMATTIWRADLPAMKIRPINSYCGIIMVIGITNGMVDAMMSIRAIGTRNVVPRV